MKKLLLILVMMMVLPMVSALVYQQNAEIDIKTNCFNNGTYCTASAQCNISIYYPNETIIVNNQPMTNQESFYNYTLSSAYTGTLGEYHATLVCIDGVEAGNDEFTFDITYNGKEKPTEWIIIIFMIFFIVLIGGFIITLFLIIRDFAAHNIDVIDVAKYFSMYLALVTVYYFSQDYLGNNLVDNVLSLFIKFGIVTHGIVLFTGFVFSLVINKVNEAKRIRFGG